MDEARAILKHTKRLLRDFDLGSQMRKDVWLEDVNSLVIYIDILSVNCG